MSTQNTPLRDDLLIGAEAIAAFVGVDERAVYHATRKGHLPVFKIGPKLAARKPELRRALSAMDGNGGGK